MPTIIPATTMFTAKSHPQVPHPYSFWTLAGVWGYFITSTCWTGSGSKCSCWFSPALGFAWSCVWLSSQGGCGSVVLLYCGSHHIHTHAHTISLAFSSPYHPINCFTCYILHNERGPQGQYAGKLFCSERKVHHSCSVPVQCCEIIPGSCFTLPLGYLLHWMTSSCSVHWDFETSC